MPSSASKETILVVDDAAENLEVISGILRAEYKVKVATGGEKALAIALSSSPPDLILLDVMMPGLSGFQVCEKLKQNPATRRIPVIFCTAMNEVKDEAQGFAAGGVDYITKPVSPPIMLARVKTHLMLFRQERELAHERDRAESLLLNILPVPIATRLKASPTAIADGFNEVSVIFADIVNFTGLSARLPPERLVDLLNRIFTAFDHIARRHGVEKIKTIGDAYMVASGVPEPRDDHIAHIADCALEMREAAGRFEDPEGQPVRLRIGIATGPAVAGVIGQHKFAYDLWGDTVNTAARMESHGAIGRIQVTGAVHEGLKDLFSFEPRGAIEVKGKGSMQTWWLLGRRPTAAAD